MLPSPSLPFLLLPECAPAPVLDRPRVVIAVTGALADIPRCLLGLLRQRNPAGLRLDAGGIGVVLAPQGPRADLAALLAALAGRLPFPLRVALSSGGAGWAWRDALTTARDWTGPEGIILALDAAAVPEAGWAAALVAAIGAGAEVATGRHRPPRWPNPLGRYAAVLEAIAVRLDPQGYDSQGHDPQGQAHGWQSLPPAAVGSLAVTAAALPAEIPAADAAGQLAALRQRDALFSLAPEALVTAAAPGTAPERLGPACRRLRARAALRRLWQDGTGSVAPENAALWALARRCGLPAGALARLLGNRYFEAAWSELETACPGLRPQPLAPGHLPAELLRARLLLGWLRLQRAGRGTGW